MNEMDIILTEKDIDPKVKVTARYRHLCHTFIQIASEASESKERYELAVNGANEIIVKLKDIKKRNESREELASSNIVQNELSEIVFVDNTNVTKVTGLKRKEPTRCSNIRPKSFMKKSKKKSRSSLPKSSQCQTDQQSDHLPCFQVPSPPLLDTSNAMGMAEGSFSQWCPFQLSQGYSSNESLTQHLRGCLISWL